jgi:hypothetical protein
MERMRSIAASIAPAVYSATTGSRRPRAAEGYMPTVMAEADDIKKGVGGARSSDRPVVIPNFAFGKGKTGTMVAHTGEYIVPNFASGGSAIFNRDMVKTMGLPEGARKIGAAGGFIPNFAIKGENRGDFKTSLIPTLDEKEKTLVERMYKKNVSLDLRDASKVDQLLSGIGRGSIDGPIDQNAKKQLLSKINAQRSGRQEQISSTILKLDADSFGGLALVSVSGATEGIATAKGKLSPAEKALVDGIIYKQDEKSKKGAKIESSFTHATMSNVKTRSLKYLEGTHEEKQKQFRQKTKDLFIPPLLELGKSLIDRKSVV